MPRKKVKRRRDAKAWRPALSVAQILEWADAHFARTGKWPTVQSGKIGVTGETWLGINGHLQKGTRGLPVNWSLAQLLHDHRGKRNPKRLPNLTIEQILIWVDAHRERTGAWPKRDSGQILGTGETWHAVEMALSRGTRGLSGHSTLPELLREHRGVRNRSRLPRLTRKQILKWADAHHARSGEWPSPRSGPIAGTDEDWKNVDNSLKQGDRGLAGESSLARLLCQHRGIRNQADLAPYQIEEILRWVDAHRERTGEWPTKESGQIAGTDETWAKVNGSLSKGRRGLPGGSSLPELLREQRGVRNRKHLPRLTQTQILKWADAHFARTGQWPNVKRGGPIQDAPGETWSGVGTALEQGIRGLKRGTTLPELLYRHRGVHPHPRVPRLSYDQIRAWAETYRERTGRWPTPDSGPIPEAPGETWGRVSSALRSGRRGLTARATLSEFLTGRKRTGWSPRPKLTVEQILAWADAYLQEHGQWPTQHSGPIDGVTGENWGAVNAALHAGRRGLPAGWTLGRLFRVHREESR